MTLMDLLAQEKTRPIHAITDEGVMEIRQKDRREILYGRQSNVRGKRGLKNAFLSLDRAGTMEVVGMREVGGVLWCMTQEEERIWT